MKPDDSLLLTIWHTLGTRTFAGSTPYASNLNTAVVATTLYFVNGEIDTRQHNLFSTIWHANGTITFVRPTANAISIITVVVQLTSYSVNAEVATKYICRSKTKTGAY